MAMIESLCFPFRREWRKFPEIIDGLEWKQKGGVQPRFTTQFRYWCF
jgi:hypothetical protein